MSETGYTYPGDASNSGSPSWSTPTNLIYGGSSTCTLTGAQTSSDIVAFDFGFAVPANTEITGIDVIIIRSKDDSSTIYDDVVKLRKAGVAVGSNRADGGNWVEGGSSYTHYGSDSYMWGTTWTAADVNNTNFGVQLSAERIEETGDTDITISDLQVIVYYNLLSAPTVTTQAATSVTTKTATANGNITDIGSSSVTQHGFCLKEGSDPVNIAGADSYSELGAGSAGAFDDALTGLSKTTTYYYRAYATNGYATGYGDAVSFTTETYLFGAVDIDASSSLTQTGDRVRYATVPISSTPSVLSAGGTVKQGDVSIDTQSALVDVPLRIRQGACVITSSSNIVLVWQVAGVCAITITPSMYVRGTHHAVGRASIDVDTSVTANANYTWASAAVDVDVVSSVVATGNLLAFRSASITAISSVQLDAVAYFAQLMGYTGTLSAGDVLVIDCDEQTVTLNGSNATRYFTGSFPQLYSGTNELRWKSDETPDASFETKHEPRYL